MAIESEGGVDLEVRPARELDDATRARVLALFRASYRGADEAYLERSFGALRFLATASAAGELAGFALGEMRVMDLPRLPQQKVALAGMCCIAPGHRRGGLFRKLAVLTFQAAGIPPEGRLLSCGRVAHPASFRTMTGNPTHVPKRDVHPTRWQQEVGAAIAAAYGVREFDPRTFVCRGRGVAIGEPILEMNVEPHEWEVFRPVDRARGDVLLGLCWTPDAPEGWLLP